ncbi:cycloartenol synthase [Planctomycetota bacterium]|nr:cycloartenol synthase [Planctomycetota bacterium]
MTIALRSASLVLAAAVLGAAEPLPTKDQVASLIGQAQNWLVAQQQASGAFVPGNKFTLGVTQLSLVALASQPLALKATEPAIAKGLAFTAKFRQTDGSFMVPEEGLANYCTSLQLQVFAATATGAPAEIKAAQEFLFGIQNAQAGSINQGGIGYGSRGAGNEDLNNTTFSILALRNTGVPASDPRMQAAVKFLERCQNLSAVNTLPWVTGDGGAVYSPDESKVNGSWDRQAPTPDKPAPKLASYGTMTYSLISSYLALDVGKDDPRVKAARDWIAANWTLDANPGMVKEKEKQGLLYYYTIMARTLDVLDIDQLDTKAGKVDWRAELFAAIKKRAQTAKLPDGGEGVFWINEADRWGEGLPQLGNGYLIQALKRIHQAL